MNEQLGALYRNDPANIVTPFNSQTQRLFRSSIDEQWYVKKSDGSIELFTVGMNGIMELVGGWDASGGTFPVVGSGPAGAVDKGDTYFVTVAGTLNGVDVEVGDVLIAKIDVPGQLNANWIILEHNFGFVPENVANKAVDFTTINDILYPTVKAVEDRIVAGGFLSGLGTAGFVPKYTAANTLGDSLIESHIFVEVHSDLKSDGIIVANGVGNGYFKASSDGNRIIDFTNADEVTITSRIFSAALSPYLNYLATRHIFDNVANSGLEFFQAVLSNTDAAFFVQTDAGANMIFASTDAAGQRSVMIGNGAVDYASVLNSVGLNALNTHFAFKAKDSTGDTLFSVRNDGFTFVNGTFSLFDDTGVFEYLSVADPLTFGGNVMVFQSTDGNIAPTLLMIGNGAGFPNQSVIAFTDVGLGVPYTLTSDGATLQFSTNAGAPIIFDAQGNINVGSGPGASAAVNIGQNLLTMGAHLNLNTAIAPAAPVDGDIWFDAAVLNIRIAGVTRTVNVT